VQVNSPRVDYCVNCGAPINSLLAFNPFDQTLIEGFAYLRAVEQQDRADWNVASISPHIDHCTGVFFRASPAIDGALGELAFWGIYFLLSVAILYRTTTNFLSKRYSPATGSETTD
jgi:hypothetical protein